MGASEQQAENNWRVKYATKHSQQCFSLNNATLKLDPFDSSGYPSQMPSYQPVFRGINAWDIKQIVSVRPRMVCLLTTNGVLRIFNSPNIEDVLQRTANFTEADSLSAVSLRNDGPCLLPNQFVTFPGRVHHISDIQKREITILADRLSGNTVSGEERKEEGP